MSTTAPVHTDIPWGDGGLAPENSWSAPTELIAIAIEMLPTIVADDVASLVELLVLALIEKTEDLEAVRAVQSLAFAVAYDNQRQEQRLRERYHALLDARRAEKAIR